MKTIAPPRSTPLKTQLQQIAAAHYALPNDQDPYNLALEMMEQIGTIDSELRDDLIYDTFVRWISKQKVFTGEQLHQLLDIGLDEMHLFFGLGEQNTDSVFTRTFSMLILALGVNAHRETPFLTAAEVKNITARVIGYLEQEKDLRGYVEGKGWAHAVAHASDTLDELALCQETDAADLRSILNIVMEKVCETDAPYIYQEDDRMTTAVVSIFHRGLLGDSEVITWIRSFSGRLQELPRAPENFRRLNIRNFLPCLYFRLKQNPGNESLELAIQELHINP